MQARPSSIPRIRIWSIIGLAILGDPGAVSGGGTGQKKNSGEGTAPGSPRMRISLQCRRILARSRASAFDQASAILDSNSEEAWGETKMRPREWELG